LEPNQTNGCNAATCLLTVGVNCLVRRCKLWIHRVWRWRPSVDNYDI